MAAKRPPCLERVPWPEEGPDATRTCDRQATHMISWATHPRMIQGPIFTEVACNDHHWAKVTQLTDAGHRLVQHVPLEMITTSALEALQAIVDQAQRQGGRGGRKELAAEMQRWINEYRPALMRSSRWWGGS